MNTKTESPAITFSDSVSQHYDNCLGPMFFEPYAIEVAKRINPASVHVALELACGTGRVTRHLRNAIPANAKLIASDISSDMMAVAKEKLSSANIDWQIIDAAELPFDDNSIDLVVCCFGYMFVPDKVKAYDEVHRILKPGGMLLITTWDKLEHNGASYVCRMIVEKYLTEPLPETCNHAVSMSDDKEIKKDLQQAGFSKIITERVDKISESRSAKEAAEALTQSGPVYDEIMKRNPARINDIKETVEKELSEKFGASPMKAPISALITQAWKDLIIEES
jgi:ubiquinone/menaquinone biosynthesis C-methylase UbiE